MKALFVDCGNPVHSYPEGDKTAAALEELELLVSIDFYMTETSRHADYILPAMTFYEREDLTDLWVTNAVRPWVQYTPPVIGPRGEARPESRSEEHTSELQSLMRISYAVFCLKKKIIN